VRSARPVHVVVRLGRVLHGFERTPLAAVTARALDSDLTALLGRIGLANDVSVKVMRGSGTRPVSVEIGHQTLAYPPVTMLRAWLSVAPPELHTRYLVEAEGEAYPSAWLEAYLKDEPNWSLVAAWLERLVYQAVLERPSLLLGAGQLADCTAEIGADRQRASGLVLPLVDLGVSVADRATLARELAEGRSIGRPLEDTVESAFSELRTHRLEVCVHPATLGQLSPRRDKWKVASVYEEDDDSVVGAIFRSMEETFFLKFGFRLPDIVWVPSPELQQHHVALKIDQWWAPAVPFPPDGFRLVNAPAGALDNYGGEPAVHPIYGTPCALIEDRHEWKDELESRGLATWGPIDFVVLNLYGELDRRPQRLLGIEEVEYELARLENFGFGAVVAAALAHYSLGELTRIFRASLAEGISLRNLPVLLERLVEFDVVEVPEEGLVVLDDRLPIAPADDGYARNHVAEHYRYLRRRLARLLSSTQVSYGDTLVAYELAPELDERARAWEAEPPSASEAVAFRDDVWRAVRSSSRLPFGQVLITSDAARAGVRSVLAPELPALTVLSGDEVAPGIQISSLGTIG
jgi:FHIPEP family